MKGQKTPIVVFGYREFQEGGGRLPADSWPRKGAPYPEGKKRWREGKKSAPNLMSRRGSPRSLCSTKKRTVLKKGKDHDPFPAGTESLTLYVCEN